MLHLPSIFLTEDGYQILIHYFIQTKKIRNDY